MNKFYNHLVEIESIIIELDKLDLSYEQKDYLARLVDSSLHHTILDAILSELKPQDKKVFLKTLEEDDHSKIWTFLNEHIEKIEEKIKNTAEDLKIKLHKDLKEAGKNE